VLPSSRQPARLSSIIVTLSLLFIAALLASVNQLLASGWGTLACFSLLCALAMWMPVGLTGGKLSSVSLSITEPAPVKAVIGAITKRKWGVTLFYLFFLLFVGCFMGLSNAVSMVTQQFQESMNQLNLAVRLGNNQDNWAPMLKIVLPMIQTLFEVVAKTYLAQIFYTDAATVAIALMWHNDRADSPDVAEKRAAELAEVAQALERNALQRQLTSVPRSRVDSNVKNVA